MFMFAKNVQLLKALSTVTLEQFGWRVSKDECSMDKKRRKEPKWGSEREGEGFVQRSQPRKARIESAPTRRRLPARFFLREDDGHEEETNFSEDSQRPEQPH